MGCIAHRVEVVPPIGKVKCDKDHCRVCQEAHKVENPDPLRLQESKRVVCVSCNKWGCSSAVKLAAVQRHPQQRNSLQSPCLRVTLVGGTRYLYGLKSGTDVKSSPDVGTA